MKQSTKMKKLAIRASRVGGRGVGRSACRRSADCRSADSDRDEEEDEGEAEEDPILCEPLPGWTRLLPTSNSSWRLANALVRRAVDSSRSDGVLASDAASLVTWFEAGSESRD